MAGVSEEESRYCKPLTLAQINEAFGEHASGMLSHYKNEWIECCKDRDSINLNEDLDEEQKKIALVFLKHINQENRIMRAIKHCERVVAMRRGGNTAVIPMELAKMVPIETLVNLDGLKRVGDKIKAYCPFPHAKKTYTFVINANNTFICFNCGAKGSAIDFVMRRDGVDMMTASRTLMKMKYETERV